ncbi:hypothetical protein SLS54_007277 [Diplodia seriata]
MDPQLDSRIVKLPQELIDRIVDFLPTVDLGSLRRTSKLMEHHLLTYFSKHYFTKKQFMVSEASLRALVDISEHPSFSPCLKHLIIGLDCYMAIPFGVAEPYYVQCKRGAESQRRMFSTGRATRLLAKALSNLKNLQTIDIRDFDSQTRFRDRKTGSGAWRSWGAPTIDAHGKRLTMHDTESSHVPDNHFHNRVFQAVLAAMADSSGRPQALVVNLRHRDRGLADGAFGLDGWMEESIAPALAGLQILHLDVSLDERPRVFNMISDQNDTLQDIADSPNTCIRHFLSCTPNVRWLRLNFQSTHIASSFRLINWLTAVPGIDPAPKILPWYEPSTASGPFTVHPWGDDNPAPVALPLTQLDLGLTHISSSVLRSLFQKFTNLNGLSLFNITLHPTTMIRPPRRTNLWADTFQALSADPPAQLKSLKMRRLIQVDTERGNNHFREVGIDGKPESKIEVSKKALQQLAEVLTIDWPSMRPTDDYSDGGEDEEDEDEDEDNSEDDDDV